MAPLAHWRDTLEETDSNQRESMGLLEYQAMHSLREVAHDGWLWTFTKQQLGIAPVRATDKIRKRQAVLIDSY